MNRLKGNSTLFLIGILLVSFIVVIYLNVISLTDNHSTYANFKDTGIHFHGEIMRNSTPGTGCSDPDVGFPNSDLSQDYQSPLFHKKLPFSVSLQQHPIGFSTSYAAKSAYQKNYTQLHPMLSPGNFINASKQNRGQNPNSSWIVSGFSSQTFTSGLFPGKKIRSHKLITPQNDSTQQHEEFHVLHSLPASNADVAFVNYYGVQNDIIDPGDPPDGDEIPVPNGTYFLLVLSCIYACWKIKNVRE